MKTPAKDSKPRELKPEQAAAAHTLDRHVSVTAGPGAGKTTVLVERYLEILRTQKVSVENVVAITFTNRAANEMRERVRREIDKILRAAGAEERQRWLRHKRALESAVITTIHGFCSRLLHEFPVEANLDPQFVLLNEHQAAMMLDAVVEETLTETIQHGNEKIIQLAQGVGRGALADALARLYLKYRGEGLALAEVEAQTANSHALDQEYFAALSELDAHMRVLLAARLTRAAEEKRSRAAQEWPALRAVLAQPPNEQTIARYCQKIEDFRETRLNKNAHPAVPLVDDLLWGANSKAEDCLRGRVPALGFDLLAKDYALALLHLLHEIDRRLEVEKQRISVLDFDDLQLRTLKLLTEHPEALLRVTERYRFFLVDEFQDTNGLQRELMKRLGLVRGTNLFIVGDRKQSIYGFRGADVDVFREMTEAILAAGGVPLPLQRNFRSQKPLIDSFNFLFERVFQPRFGVAPAELTELGFVAHDPGEAERGTDHQPPLVELIVGVVPDVRRFTPDGENGDEDDEGAQPGERERDAAQVVERIRSLIDVDGFEYRDIAILFRALTGSWTYESALRRAGIPYLTVQGKGFYQREEITDLIQLLRLLDNNTDELALAAVLRSPLCGISDNALFALRCAPEIGETQNVERLQRRNLLRALRQHREIAFIEAAEHDQLDRANLFIESLIARRSRQRISDLLRGAVNSSEFMPVIAANFDGAQRIANVEKLFRLAEQFEKSGQLIRDFVHYVEEFEEVGGRESEGQMDESADVVRLMTIHQAKGLEYPVVIIPDVHREQKLRDTWYLLDRHRGLTVRVPDGRGGTARGALYNELRKRARLREEFEGMRLLYVAATRAEDKLIFSGAVAQKSLKNLGRTEQEQWLAWIWQALELDDYSRSGQISFGDDVQFQVTIERDRQTPASSDFPAAIEEPAQAIDPALSLSELFPLLEPIAPERGQAWRRFSVTQLLNFQRCARQYYFDRMLRAPSAEDLAVWNDAEAPEPPANLTATLKGAVIHRFCEVFREGDDVKELLQASFAEVRAQRQAELAGRVYDINDEEAIRELMPLAEHYLASDVFRRVTATQKISREVLTGTPHSEPGLWSELRFRLRRNLGILTGTIDKLLITPSASGDGVDVEIIDFKTNRFRSRPAPEASGQGIAVSAAPMNQPAAASSSGSPQGFFNFDAPAATALPEEPSRSFQEDIEMVAHDYQLQMQSYALALRELLGYRTAGGNGTSLDPAKELKINSLRATLHFLEPNIEVSVEASLLEHDNCARAIDDAMLAIASLEGTLEASLFPPNPASHCRMCNFLDLCPAGSDWLRDHKRVK